MRQSYFHFVIVGLYNSMRPAKNPEIAFHEKKVQYDETTRLIGTSGQEVSGCAYLILYTSKITFSRFRIQIDDHILWNLEL